MDSSAIAALQAEAKSEHASLLAKAASQHRDAQALVDGLGSFAGEREGLSAMADIPKAIYDELERDIAARHADAKKVADDAIQAFNATQARIRELGGLDGNGGKIAFYGRALARLAK